MPERIGKALFSSGGALDLSPETRAGLVGFALQALQSTNAGQSELGNLAVAAGKGFESADAVTEDARAREKAIQDAANEQAVLAIRERGVGAAEERASAATTSALATKQALSLGESIRLARQREQDFRTFAEKETLMNPAYDGHSVSTALRDPKLKAKLFSDFVTLQKGVQENAPLPTAVPGGGAGLAEMERLLNLARGALAAGKSRAAIEEILIEKGIDPRKL